ncbi:MAG: AarF/ABC1/UbiB kinase family protein [Myxococcales bacterium]|nr:AarF/ABC1/UbiB kinase family protein [Myxococcales bacterium]
MSSPPTGRLARLARLAGVAAATTRDVVTARARQKLTGAVDLDFGGALQPTAERLVEVLGGMKGAATKLGQFMSLVDQEVFPPEARKSLQRLLNQTPQRMDARTARAAVEQELEGPLSRFFAHFEPEPLAAASVGQVHAATTLDGRDVVVKVQFPGVDRAIEADLKNLGALTRAMAFGGGILDQRDYSNEIAATLRRELDYGEEIVQLRAYADALRPWPDLVVPDVVEALSTRRVLTMQRLHRPTMLEFADDPAASPADRLRVGGQLVAATWGPFLRQGLIHADPHPGNYIVLDHGRLGVLDFGATRQLTPAFVRTYWRLLEAAWYDERPAMAPLLEAAGFRIEGDRERAERWLQGLAHIVERPFRSPTYDWAACRIALDVRTHTTGELLAAVACRPPDESLMFYRAAAGAAGDLRLLRANGSFRDVLQQVYATARAHLAAPIAAVLGPKGVRPIPT